MTSRPPDPAPATPPPTRAAGPLVEVDGLRGLAILGVMVHHFFPEAGLPEVARRAVDFGWAGVDLFFVVSGFLITGILLDTRTRPGYYRTFYVRRSLRIFPLYYLFLIAAFTLIPLVQRGTPPGGGFADTAGSPAWYALYLANLRVILYGWPNELVGLLWSLSVEEQFYILFPPVVAVLSPRRLVRLLVLLALLAPALRLEALFLWPDNWQIQYAAPFARMDTLALGGLIAIAVRARARAVARGWWGPAAALAGAILAALVLAGAYDRKAEFTRVVGYSVTAACCALAVLWAVANRGRARTAPLRFPPLAHLGRRCYALYLLHLPAALVLDRALSLAGVPAAGDSAWLFAGRLAAALVAAEVSWRLIERPILQLKDRYSPRPT